jgi:CheY-like chemotaxis protein
MGVEVDQGQIEQLLLNLYVNAWHAMSGGEISSSRPRTSTSMNLMSDPMSQTRRYVKVSVTDTGTGMDKNTLNRVFEPFFTTRDKSRGSGLGLASAYGIIRNHEGFIGVYSEVGKGTTFNVYLPASDKSAHVGEERTKSDMVKGTERVLLIDDEDMIIDIGSQILNVLGYKVMAARSGEEAVELFGSHKDEIDLVILDMIMPGISGAETYERIRGLDRNIKVILSSGYSLNEDAAQIMKRGCNGFIQKPFQPGELSLKIRQILDA